jgi:signal transduction histidine kinase
MQGYIETLLIRDDRLSDAERREYLEVAARHAAHLNRLVSELFELTKLENLSMIPVSEPFSIAELLQDIGQEFELLARQRQIRLIVDEPRDNVYVNGDIGLIQRVLENLIENALRHTPKGGSVKIALAPGTRHVEVTVADSGCGIRSEQVSRIFERFYRAEGETGSGQPSAGLGLAIVKRILELHNSTIRVASEVDVGTSFTFELPRPQRVA